MHCVGLQEEKEKGDKTAAAAAAAAVLGAFDLGVVDYCCCNKYYCQQQAQYVKERE